MPRVHDIPKAKKQAARKDLEKVIRKHGKPVVVWAWNQITKISRLRKKLQRQKAWIERELADVESKLR